MTPEVPLIVLDTQQKFLPNTLVPLVLNPNIQETTNGGMQMALMSVEGQRVRDPKLISVEKKLIARLMQGLLGFRQAQSLRQPTHLYYGHAAEKK